METPKTTTGLPRNTAAALAYVALWPGGLIFLLIEKDPFVRFHAMQSIIVFGLLTLLYFIWIIRPIILLAFFGLWLFLMIKAYEGEEYGLPKIGDFVRKSLGESK